MALGIANVPGQTVGIVPMPKFSGSLPSSQSGESMRSPFFYESGASDLIW